jgi:hypothetical protein
MTKEKLFELACTLTAGYFGSIGPDECFPTIENTSNTVHAAYLAVLKTAAKLNIPIEYLVEEDQE